MPHMGTGTLVRAAPHKLPVPMCGNTESNRTKNAARLPVLFLQRFGRDHAAVRVAAFCAFIFTGD